jgi:hypothetical protein
MKSTRIKLLAVGAVATLVTVIAQANTITGSLWKVPEAVVDNPTGATTGNVPGTAADVTFSVNSPFNFNAANATVGNWLASGSAFNILENTAGTLASQMDDFTTGTIIDFKGFVSVINGQTFTVTHDDGLTLTIGGILAVNHPEPTAPDISTDTYTGPTGTFAFELVYTECCSGPAVLQLDLPLEQSVPDGGSTMALLGGALTMMGVVARRFRK